MIMLASHLTVAEYFVEEGVVRVEFEIGVAGLQGFKNLVPDGIYERSLRLRRREIETLIEIGGSRLSVAAVMTSEIIVVLAAGVVLAAVMTFVTSQFGSVVIRALIRT